MSDGPFTCYDSDRDVKTVVYLNGEALTVGRVVDLLNRLDVTADGVPLADVQTLYCPHCGGEIECRDSFTAFCWACGNPEDQGAPPLPLFYDQVLAKPRAGK